MPREVYVHIEGVEVAKWLASTVGYIATLDRIGSVAGPHAFISTQYMPVYKDVGEDAESDLPYLGAASVRFRLLPALFEDGDSNALICIKALNYLDQHDVPVLTATRFEVSCINHKF